MLILVLSVLLVSHPAVAQNGYWSLSTYGSGRFSEVMFSDTTNGWVVGDSGKIMRTTNSGISWSAQLSHTNRNLYCVYFVNHDTGYAAGAGGMFLSTSNGGGTWSVHPTAIVAPWKRIYFSDAETGWLCSDTVSSRINYTTDGGSTWIQVGPQLRPSLPSADMVGMSFSSGSNGWVVSDSVLAHTTDGVTWTPVSPSFIPYLFNVSFPTDSVGYVVKIYSNGTSDISGLFSTSDGGQNWTQLPVTFVNIYVRSIQFLSVSEGWIVGDSLSPIGQSFVGGVGYHTTDGGNHWTHEFLFDAANSYSLVSGVFFRDAAHGWIAGVSYAANPPARMIGKYFGPVTAVREKSNALPAKFSLDQNYPNPFNPITVIHFTMAEAGYVRLEIFDLSGKEVTTLIDRYRHPGEYSVTWDAAGYTSGVYVCRLEVGSFIASRKMILVK